MGVRTRTKKEVKALIESLNFTIERISEVKWSNRTGAQHTEMHRAKAWKAYLIKSYGLEKNKTEKK